MLAIDSREDRANWWHTDVTFLATPPLARSSTWRGCPRSGGDTMWASLQDAYDGLAEPVRAMCDELIAIHHDPWFAAEVDERGGYDWDGVHHDEAACRRRTRWCGRTPRPVGTGCSSTRTSPSYPRGCRQVESDAMLDMLYRHCQRPEFTCRFHWQAGIGGLLGQPGHPALRPRRLRRRSSASPTGSRCKGTGPSARRCPSADRPGPSRPVRRGRPVRLSGPPHRAGAAPDTDNAASLAPR